SLSRGEEGSLCFGERGHFQLAKGAFLIWPDRVIFMCFIQLLQNSVPKKWLKTQEVMEMLGMSEVTLQTLRNKGVIPFRKLGGICYYNLDELNDVIYKLK
ncbi:helix-turn-helix domain-containing protein, partial [Mucilaginibacter sp. 22184]|uniref:helix-turn-helix domain-containing protein n=1 Tax=Mucilaginibacter sp. 22184 TaxID=3453887 RepID=UPI003F87E6EA